MTHRLRDARLELNIAVCDAVVCACGNTIEAGDLYCCALSKAQALRQLLGTAVNPWLTGHVYCLACGTHELERRAQEWLAEQAQAAGLPVVVS